MLTHPQNIDQLVEQFVQLRDKIKAADDAHKKKVGPAKEYLDVLSGKLMEQLNTIGGDSVKTPSGTVYRSTRRTASIADGQVFRKYVVDNGAYDMVDWRANANAVEDFIQSQGSTPPGVNFSKAHTVGVRRA